MSFAHNPQKALPMSCYLLCRHRCLWRRILCRSCYLSHRNYKNNFVLVFSRDQIDDVFMKDRVMCACNQRGCIKKDWLMWARQKKCVWTVQYYLTMHQWLTGDQWLIWMSGQVVLLGQLWVGAFILGLGYIKLSSGQRIKVAQKQELHRRCCVDWD